MRSNIQGLWILAGWSVLSITSVCWAQVDAVANARHDLQLAFTVAGKIVSVPVKPGDRVTAGQVLIIMEDDEGQALVELYELRSASDLELRSAQEQLELAKIEAKAIKEAFEKDAASKIELDRAEVRARLAEIEVSVVRQRHQETKLQLVQARARHDQFTMLAPVDGIVDQIAVSEGETVDDYKPVVRLVVTDPLWVDAAVPTEETLRVTLDDPAWVTFNLPGFDQPFQGKVIHIASVADAASDTRLVRVQVPNSHNLPAGCQVKVSFQSPSAQASRAADGDPVPEEF